MTEFSEELLGRQLSERLHEVTSTMQPSPNLVAIVRRRQKRRTWGVAIAGTLPVVIAIALLGALAVSGSRQRAAETNGDAPSVVSGGSPTTSLVNVDSVSSRTMAALDDVRQYIRVSRESTGASAAYSEVHADVATERERWDEYDASGTHTKSWLIVGHAANNTVLVNWTAGTWYRDSFGTRDPAPEGDVSGSGVDPAAIKHYLDSGKLVLVGEETANGAVTQHLRYTLDDFTWDVWVDASTYLPVKEAAANPRHSAITTHQWLPRTPQNLAMMELTVPPGFSQVPTPLHR